MNQQRFKQITAATKVGDRSDISLGPKDDLFWFLGDDQTIYFSGEECPDSYSGCVALFAAMYEMGERLGLDVTGLEIGLNGSTPYLSWTSLGTNWTEDLSSIMGANWSAIPASGTLLEFKGDDQIANDFL